MRPVCQGCLGAFPSAAFPARGIPQDGQIGGQFLSRKAEAVLKEMGATNIWRNEPGAGLSGGQHQAGTCRMGKDPKTSVTNPFGQVHQIDNLFIADASLHVNNGGFNPVLTIMANAYRDCQPH